MFRYIVRRLFWMIPTLLVIISLAFFLMHAVPGGPFDNERRLPPEVEANIKAAYHLDKPIIWQFGYYLNNLLHGDLGPSFRYRERSVNDLVGEGFPISALLGGIAMIVAIVVGVSVGTFAAFRQNKFGDYAIMGFVQLGVAIPNFVVAPTLTLVFGLWWGIFKTGGWNASDVSYWILPILVLCHFPTAAIARLTRGSVIEVLRSNYVRTARAKGLPSLLITQRHVMKAALAPVISYLGPATAQTITGSLIVEKIFTIPGVGTYFIDGALNRDYTLVMGVTILYGALILLFNLFADIAYGFIDPKVRY